jgi:hypothetical protein
VGESLRTGLAWCGRVVLTSTLASVLPFRLTLIRPSDTIHGAAVPALLAERCTAQAALARSRELTEGISARVCFVLLRSRYSVLLGILPTLALGGVVMVGLRSAGPWLLVPLGVACALFGSLFPVVTEAVLYAELCRRARVAT